MNLLTRSEHEQIATLYSQHIDYINHAKKEWKQKKQSIIVLTVGIVVLIFILSFFLTWGVIIQITFLFWSILVLECVSKYFESTYRNKIKEMLVNYGFDPDQVDAQRWDYPRELEDLLPRVWKNEAEFIDLFFDNLSLERVINEATFHEMLRVSITSIQLRHEDNEIMHDLFHNVKSRINSFESTTFPKPKVHPARFMKHLFFLSMREELEFHSQKRESHEYKQHDEYISLINKLFAEFQKSFTRRRIGGDIAVNLEEIISVIPESMFHSIFVPFFFSKDEFKDFIHQWRKSYSELLIQASISDQMTPDILIVPEELIQISDDILIREERMGHFT